MPYFYETHAHTAEVSPCSHVPAAQMVEAYIQAGYAGVVITDHFASYICSPREGENWEMVVSRWLKGYRAAKEAAGDRLTVLLGMEMRIGDNDYLVYGLTEAFLFEHEELLTLDIGAFHKLANQHGMPVYQAHPFRNGMRIVAPHDLDGIEVFNGNPRHDSRNDIAAMWAEKFGLKTISGSDYHEPGDLARGGIAVDRPIYTNEDLLTALQQGVQLLRFA